MRGPGFSLAETLVALAAAGVLLAGMVQVFTACQATWSRVNAALAAQRGLDWALARMAADLELDGHLLPLPGRALPNLPPPCGDPDPLVLVHDRPLPAALVLAEALPRSPAPEPDPPGPGAEAIRVRARRSLRLRAGDLLLAPGRRLEWATVAEAVVLAPGRAGLVRLAPGEGPEGLRASGEHPAGTPLEALRPGRVVRYAVVRLDPADDPDPGGTPCLTRFETAWPGRPDPAARGVRRQVLVRGVTGFRVKAAPGAFRVDLAVARAARTLRVERRHGGGR